MSRTSDYVIINHEESVQDQTEDTFGLRSQEVNYYDYANKYRFDDDSRRKTEPRYILDLMVSATDPEENIATELCEKLYETRNELILRIVQVIGGEKTLELFKETQQLEKAGGMMVKQGTRRRSSGDVFLFLLTRDTSVPQEIINQIKQEDKIMYMRKIEALRVKSSSRQITTELLQQNLTDSGQPSLSRAEASVQSEQGSNPPPSPGKDTSDNLSNTDTHTDVEVDVENLGDTDTHTDVELDIDNLSDDTHTDVEVDIENFSDTDTHTDVEMDIYNLNDTDSHTDAEVDIENLSDTDTHTDFEVDTDNRSDTDTYTDDEVDIPMGQAHAHICAAGIHHIRETIGISPQQESPCVWCAFENNRRV